MLHTENIEKLGIGPGNEATSKYVLPLSLIFSYSVSMEELLDAASTRLPTLRGLKYTDYNLMELGRCLSGNGGKYQVLYGRDEVGLYVYIVLSYMYVYVFHLTVSMSHLVGLQGQKSFLTCMYHP